MSKTPAIKKTKTLYYVTYLIEYGLEHRSYDDHFFDVEGPVTLSIIREWKEFTSATIILDWKPVGETSVK